MMMSIPTPVLLLGSAAAPVIPTEAAVISIAVPLAFFGTVLGLTAFVLRARGARYEKSAELISQTIQSFQSEDGLQRFLDSERGGELIDALKVARRDGHQSAIRSIQVGAVLSAVGAVTLAFGAFMEGAVMLAAGASLAGSTLWSRKLAQRWRDEEARSEAVRKLDV